MMVITRKGVVCWCFFGHQIVSAVARASGSFIQLEVALKANLSNMSVTAVGCLGELCVLGFNMDF